MNTVSQLFSTQNGVSSPDYLLMLTTELSGLKGYIQLTAKTSQHRGINLLPNVRHLKQSFVFEILRVAIRSALLTQSPVLIQIMSFWDTSVSCKTSRRRRK